MPVVSVDIDGNPVSCLVDTGSGRTLVSARVVGGNYGPAGARAILLANGTASSGRERVVTLRTTFRRVKLTALVVEGLEKIGVNCLLGVDFIDAMGGVLVQRGIDGRYKVRWGAVCGSNEVQERKFPTASCAAKADPALSISDKDFNAEFRDGHWTAKWRWTGDEPARLQSRISEYKSTRVPGVAQRYNLEIQKWISNGWLVEWNGPVKGYIPLLAVVQPTKDKVRPVMDYRELNLFVESHTGDDETAVCADKLRSWRKLHGELKVVDLKDAYLQIRVARDLWQYQIVKFRGKTFALTRLGFGLTCAPRIMSMILKRVLSLDEAVRRGTDHYIDDIMVQESIVSAERVREHLLSYGLVSKVPESLDGGRVLGIALKQVASGDMKMSRGAALPPLSMCEALTKRELFSLCGRLTGHYPVASWVRPHCSLLKRLGTDGHWDKPVSDDVRRLAVDLLKRCHADDPVSGGWRVNRDGQVTVWTDASSIALGVAIQVDDSVVEDASWLRKKSDSLHINVAELEAVARGINLAILWGFTTFTVATDSRTVLSWMDSTVEGRDRVRTKSAAQMLIKRRLAVIKQVIDEYKLNVSFRFVSTVENKADTLTRVVQKWLGHAACSESAGVAAAAAPCEAAVAAGATDIEVVWTAHLPHHCGVERTLFLASKIRPGLSRELVRRTLDECEACQRIDPAARAENRVESGELSVETNWTRVAVDVTHYRNVDYLSLVDCGPSRFVLWRRLLNETATVIVTHLQQLVIERGPFVELLLDNSTSFRSAAVRRFAEEWGIVLRFRAAYAPGGNGIVERTHRTIKRIAERGQISPELATYWFNMMPRKGLDDGTVPSSQLFKYEWRPPYRIDHTAIDCGNTGFSVGDEVWVKPTVPSCTTKWRSGRVTGTQSKHVVLVDGMPRHVRDIRKRRGRLVDCDRSATDDDDFADGDDSVGGNTVPAAEQQQAPDVGAQVPPEPGVPEPGVPGPGAPDLGAPGPIAEPRPPVEVQPDAPRRSGRVRRPPVWMRDYV